MNTSDHKLIDVALIRTNIAARQRKADEKSKTLFSGGIALGHRERFGLERGMHEDLADIAGMKLQLAEHRDWCQEQLGYFSGDTSLDPVKTPVND